MSKHKTSSGQLPFLPSWESLLLICKDCRRRKNGPRHMKAKTLASDTKHFIKSSVPNGRIILTTCLKLCPSKATAIAFVTANATPRIMAVESSDQLQDMLPRLIERTA